MDICLECCLEVGHWVDIKVLCHSQCTKEQVLDARYHESLIEVSRPFPSTAWLRMNQRLEVMDWSIQTVFLVSYDYFNSPLSRLDLTSIKWLQAYSSSFAGDNEAEYYYLEASFAACWFQALGNCSETNIWQHNAMQRGCECSNRSMQIHYVYGTITFNKGERIQHPVPQNHKAWLHTTVYESSWENYHSLHYTGRVTAIEHHMYWPVTTVWSNDVCN